MMNNLKQWNGLDETGRYKYNTSDIKKWNMQVGEDGTIYYTTTDNKINVWCPASRLTNHLFRLWQITHRYTEDDGTVKMIK